MVKLHSFTIDSMVNTSIGNLLNSALVVMAFCGQLQSNAEAQSDPTGWPLAWVLGFKDTNG